MGRFGEALQCYDRAVGEGSNGPGIVGNRNAVAEILNMIDGAEHEIQSEWIEADRVLHVLITGNNLPGGQGFGFQGNRGNTGNFSYNLPGGQGFSGKTGFAVIVRREQG